jgi:hypothetical protein
MSLLAQQKKSPQTGSTPKINWQYTACTPSSPDLHDVNSRMGCCFNVFPTVAASHTGVQIYSAQGG